MPDKRLNDFFSGKETMFVGDGFRHWERLRLLMPLAMDGVIRCKAVGLTGLFTLNVGPEAASFISRPYRPSSIFLRGSQFFLLIKNSFDVF
jgi:hypothetical protein